MDPDAAAAAVEEMNGSTIDDLVVDGPGDAELTVVGGPELFLISATRDQETFLLPHTDAGDAAIEISAGSGAVVAYPARRLVDRATAVRIARTWVTDGALDDVVTWVKSDL